MSYTPFASKTHKTAVRAATTANLTLTTEQTIDSVVAVTGDRVLVKNQTTGSENGIYIISTGAWTRATDFDSSSDIKAGVQIFVTEGGTQGDTLWHLTTDNPITLGSTSLTFTQFTSAGITGSGVAGRVTYWSGTSAITSSANLFWDNTNSRLGIGTSSPSYVLDITSSASGVRVRTTSSADQDGSFYIAADNSGNHLTMLMASSGTTTQGGFSANGAHIYTNTGIMNFTSLKATAPSLGFYTTTSNLNTADQRLIIGHTSFVINDPGNDYDTRIEGDTEANLFFVDASTDRIGIGTTTPSVRMHLVQNANLFASIYCTNTNTGTGAGSLILFGDLTGGAGYGYLSRQNSGYTDSGLFLKNQVTLFSTTGNTNGVLIAVAEGPFVISQNGFATTNERMRISTTEVIFNDASQDIDFRIEGDTDANSFFVDASQDNIGIGTNVPGTITTAGSAVKLEVLKSGQALVDIVGVSSTAGDSGYLRFVHARGTTASPTALQSGDQLGRLGFMGQFGSGVGNITERSGIYSVTTQTWSAGNVGNQIRISTAANNTNTETIRMVIDNNGFVGIGTATSPTEMLDVFAATSISGTVRSSLSTGFASLYAQNTQSTAFTQSVAFGTADGANYLGTARASGAALNMSPAGSGSAFIRVPGSNSLLIGTNDIERISIAGAGTIVINETGADADVRIEGDTEANLFFIDASTDRVGMGTATPAYALDIRRASGFVRSSVGANGTANADAGLSYVQRGNFTHYTATGTAHTTVVNPQNLTAGFYNMFYGTGSVPLVISNFDTDSLVYIGGAAGSQMIIRDHSQASVNDLAGGVGIGVTPAATPLWKLDIDTLNVTSVDGGLRVMVNSSAIFNVYRLNTGASGGTVINEAGNDRDFRIEGNGRTDLFYIDANAGTGGRIGINRTSGNVGATLDVDNTTVAESILILRDNGTAVLTVADGGSLTQENGAVFNEAGANVDFRVEGDVDTHLIFVDANALTNGAVGINQSAPTSKLHISGSVAFSTTSVSTTTTLDNTHHTVRVDASGGAVTINLPTAASSTGRVYVIKKIDATANAVTIDGDGAETIDGAATVSTTTQYVSYMIQSNATSWDIL